MEQQGLRTQGDTLIRCLFFTHALFVDGADVVALGCWEIGFGAAALVCRERIRERACLCLPDTTLDAILPNQSQGDSDGEVAMQRVIVERTVPAPAIRRYRTYTCPGSGRRRARRPLRHARHGRRSIVGRVARATRPRRCKRRATSARARSIESEGSARAEPAAPGYGCESNSMLHRLRACATFRRASSIPGALNQWLPAAVATAASTLLWVPPINCCQDQASDLVEITGN